MRFPSVMLCLLLSSGADAGPRVDEAPGDRASFAGRLERRVEQFDLSGQTLVTAVFDLAYEYKLPVAFEYVDRNAATTLISLHMRHTSIREIFSAIVAQAPEYRVDFLSGLIDIYAPVAREDGSNLLNMVVKDFSVVASDTHQADLELFCGMVRQIGSPGVCGGSIATGQWGPKKITLHMKDARVYEILNAIVAENGQAIWTVTVPAGKLSSVPVDGLWHIYPLEAPYKAPAVERLTRLSFN